MGICKQIRNRSDVYTNTIEAPLVASFLRSFPAPILLQEFRDFVGYRNVVTIENTQGNDLDLAVAFYENQVFSFSSTGKNFAITKKDMTKRFGRLIAACARLRNATSMHAIKRNVL